MKSDNKIVEDVEFHCLACGNKWDGKHTKGVVVELTCPKCLSNSVRRMKKK